MLPFIRIGRSGGEVDAIPAPARPGSRRGARRRARSPHLEVLEARLHLPAARAAPALVLAGGLALRQSSKESVLFVSADRQLLRAARAEGLRVLNPETAP